LFDAKCLRNGTRCSHSYNKIIKMSLIWDINGPYNAASDRLASRFVASDVHLTERRIDYAPYNLWT